MLAFRYARSVAAVAIASVFATAALAQRAPQPPSAPGACYDAGTKTRLLFNFATNQAGFDTGITISNTGADPFNTINATGACTLTFYGASAPAPVNTGPIAPGATWTNLASSIAPGFQGYFIAACDFPFAHGFAFVSDLGARNLAMGYLPVNVCSPRMAPD
jgi:hypothetical protein